MSDPLTAAWLSEMWPTVRQYHPGMQPRKGQPKPPRKPRDDPDAPREECPVCLNQFVSADLLQHILRSHPETVQKPGENRSEAAS